MNKILMIDDDKERCALIKRSVSGDGTEENPGRPRYIQAVKGNGNRRILAEKRELTAPLAYELNDIVRSYEDSISAYHRAEEMNRQLMTSLSHNARTPLTTGNGHLVRSLFKKKTHRPIDFRKER